jgi:hypothetical protein
MTTTDILLYGAGAFLGLAFGIGIILLSLKIEDYFDNKRFEKFRKEREKESITNSLKNHYLMPDISTPCKFKKTVILKKDGKVKVMTKDYFLKNM